MTVAGNNDFKRMWSSLRTHIAEWFGHLKGCLHKQEISKYLWQSLSMAIWKDKKISIEIASLTESARHNLHVYLSVLTVKGAFTRTTS